MKDIISCSRRTDVPAFYWEWMKEAIKKGYAESINPYNKEAYRINLSPDDIHTIVFWSKDYDKYIKDCSFLSDYHLYFQFTINDYSKLLELNVPNKKETLKQVDFIVNKFSNQHVLWRFDPIILTKDCSGENINTLPKYGNARLIAFEELCKDMSSLGINKVVTSFLSTYGHVKERLVKYKIPYKSLTEDLQCKFTEKMVEIADKYNIQVCSCSSPLIEKVEGVEKSHCIDGKLLTELKSERATKAKDQGQRKDCGCHKSRDISPYSPCGHNCVYCYARPQK